VIAVVPSLLLLSLSLLPLSSSLSLSLPLCALFPPLFCAPLPQEAPGSSDSKHGGDF